MNSNAEMDRYDSFDALKFILSIFIVAIHTEFLGDYVYPFVRIAVPIFFMISSYLFFHKHREYDFKAFIHFLKRNLQLYLFWFVVLLPITLYARKYFFAGFFLGLKDLICDFFFGSTFLASWYIVAQIIAIAWIFLLSKKANNIVLLSLSSLCYLVCLLSSNYYNILSYIHMQGVADSIFSVIFPPNSFIVAFFWCSVGKVIADTKQVYSRRKKVGIFIVLLISLIGLFGEKMIIQNCIGAAKFNDVYLFLIPVCICVFVLALECKVNIKNAVVLRRISTIVYCVHFSIAVVFSNILERFISDPMHVICFFSTLILSWSVAIIILKVSPKIKVLKYAF